MRVSCCDLHNRRAVPRIGPTKNSMATAPDNTVLEGHRVAVVGKLASMSKREAERLIRQNGGTVFEALTDSVTLVVIGEDGLPVDLADRLGDEFDDSVRAAAQRGSLEVIAESELWRRLGLLDDDQDNVQRLYTPAMLADLIGVPLSVVRRWHRRGLIVPARVVRRLPYFDFQEIATARRLAEMLSAGASPQAIEKKLATLARYCPNVERPIAQLSVIVEGKDLLLRQDGGLIEPGGQLRIDFAAAESPGGDESSADSEGGEAIELEPRRDVSPAEATPDEMLQLAGRLEDEGHFGEAVEMYRAALVASGPKADVCFLLAELLYRMGQSAAARERYYMAIELDEEFVEARANLGCVLAEGGESELAVAAFEGALRFHSDYPDAHYHLARLLDELGREADARQHWQDFLTLAPDSPWADEAGRRLADESPRE